MRKVLFITLLLSASAIAQTFHVTGVRDWNATDPAPVSRAFKVYVVSGTSGPLRYTTQQLFSWGSQHFEVGKDYDVIKVDSGALTVMTHDKKGREIKERLDVVSVEEAPSK